MIEKHTIISNITQKKYDENNIFKETDKLRAILNSSLDGIVAFDSYYDENGEIVDFIFTMANIEACKIINLKEEQLLGQKLSQIHSGNFKPLDSLDGKTLFESYKEVV